MIHNTASLDLVEYIETSVLPRYAQFDKAHSLGHVTRVIRRSISLARAVGADVNMAYCVAAYHDLGMAGPRAVHHIIGGRILERDARLRQWFTPEQIKIMREAVEDHRASASRSPRSIYGKIVAEADRDLQPDVVFRRAVQYGLDHYPQLSRQQQWQRFCSHMQAKYAPGGYIRLWLPASHNEEQLRAIRQCIASPERLKAMFDSIWESETAEREALGGSEGKISGEDFGK